MLFLYTFLYLKACCVSSLHMTWLCTYTFRHCVIVLRSFFVSLSLFLVIWLHSFFNFSLLLNCLFLKWLRLKLNVECCTSLFLNFYLYHMIILFASVLNFIAIAVARRPGRWKLIIKRRLLAMRLVSILDPLLFQNSCTKIPYKSYFKICGRRCALDGTPH